MAVLTIAIPTLNCVGTLPATLESLQRLGEEVDVVIIDSGSNDGTLEVASSSGYKVIHAPPGNLYAAINKGIANAKSEWVTYINGDDILYPETVLDRLKNSKPEASVIYGTVDYIDFQGRFIHSWRPAGPHELLTLFQAGYSPMLQQGTLFRKALFDSLGGFDTKFRYVADSDFWFRALETGHSFSRTSFPSVAGFRLHGSQITHKFEGAMADEYIRMGIDHHVKRTPIGNVSALLWRLGNWPYYLMRYIRRKDLEGSFKVAGSYDIPES